MIEQDVRVKISVLPFPVYQGKFQVQPTKPPRRSRRVPLGRRLLAAFRAFINPDLVARPSSCRRISR